MKTLIRPVIKSWLLFIAVCCTSGVQEMQAAEKLPAAAMNKKDSIIVTRSQTTNNRYKIKLYPNATNTVLFFSVAGEEGKVYQLYVFDMGGKLAKQTQIRNRETTLLTKFEKGNYTFEVFCQDDRIENGSLVVK